MTKNTKLDNAETVVNAEPRIEWNKDMNNAKENNMNQLNDAQKAMIEAAAANAPVIEPESKATNGNGLNVVAGFDLDAESAKFVIDNNRVSLLPGNCTHVEVVQDYLSCRSALTAFLDLYHMAKYRLVSPNLLFYSWINGLDPFTSKHIGYVSSAYKNDADPVMFPDGTIAELAFHKLPKVGWAELWNYTGMIGVDHKELVADSQFEVNRDQYRKCSFIRNFAGGCGYVFTFGPSFAPYVSKLFKTWNMPAEEARKEQFNSFQAKQEQKRVFRISQQIGDQLRESETDVSQISLNVKSYPNGDSVNLAGSKPGTRFQLYDVNGVKKMRVYWKDDEVSNVAMVQGACSSWLWENLGVAAAA
jgi:hypothetical protein